MDRLNLNRRRDRSGEPPVTHVARQYVWGLSHLRFEVRPADQPDVEPGHLDVTRRETSSGMVVTLIETDAHGVPLIGPLLGRSVKPADEVDPWKIRRAASLTLTGELTVSRALRSLGVEIGEPVDGSWRVPGSFYDN
jgi:hypothetical protein